MYFSIEVCWIPASCVCLQVYHGAKWIHIMCHYLLQKARVFHNVLRLRNILTPTPNDMEMHYPAIYQFPVATNLHFKSSPNTSKHAQRDKQNTWFAMTCGLVLLPFSGRTVSTLGARCVEATNRPRRTDNRTSSSDKLFLAINLLSWTSGDLSMITHKGVRFSMSQDGVRFKFGFEHSN